LTIVTSTSSMKAPVQIATSGHHLRIVPPEICPCCRVGLNDGG
jgi:hypothetical protein